MMAYEGPESARKKIGDFINRVTLEIKILVRKLERILIKFYGYMSISFNQTCLNEGLFKRIRISLWTYSFKKNYFFLSLGSKKEKLIYIYIYIMKKSFLYSFLNFLPNQSRILKYRANISVDKNCQIRQ